MSDDYEWLRSVRTVHVIGAGLKEDRPANNPDSYYQARDNLEMAFHVFKLAIEEGVRRVIVTSSNHAEDWY